jgi:hypothetical protein
VRLERQTGISWEEHGVNLAFVWFEVFCPSQCRVCTAIRPIVARGARDFSLTRA